MKSSTAVCQSLDELEQLRSKLLAFFRYNRCESPHDEAQETLSRAVERLNHPRTELHVPLKSYVFGIARNVLRESKRTRETATDPAAPEFAALTSDRELSPEEQILVQECLNCLSPDQRQQVLDYHLYGADALAEQLGISSNALRIRIHRLHRKVQDLLLQKF
jgi:RNA polymerase sigma factor (sigma-70 family)